MRRAKPHWARGGTIWTQVFRDTPIGVLVLGFLLLLIGAGLILGGAVFVFSGRFGSWPAWLVYFGAGPLALYLALHFVTRRRWARATVMVMLGLAFSTAVIRAVRADVVPVVPFSEMIVSLAALAYLLRPSVKRTFTE